MNEQPSKSGSANHSPKTSKIASSRAAGSLARRSTSACSQPRVQRSSRAARKATISSSLDAKLRYSVIFAAPASAMMRSTPTARVPCLREQLVGRVQDPLAPFGHDREFYSSSPAEPGSTRSHSAASCRISSSEKCRRKRSRTPSRCVGRAVASSSAPFSVSTA